MNEKRLVQLGIVFALIGTALISVEGWQKADTLYEVLLMLYVHVLQVGGIFMLLQTRKDKC